MTLNAKNRTLYVRGALKPFARDIKKTGGILQFLKKYVDFDDLLAPHFYPNRFFWQQPTLDRVTNSGSLGTKLLQLDESIVSAHPTHAFVGIGDRISSILKEHDHTKSCFYPLDKILRSSDFSMFLFGCVKTSPGFSTVHVNQYRLGLSQKHILRYLMRWDFLDGKRIRSSFPKEYPGCSASFHKFYDYYKSEDNFVEGDINGTPWIFIPSAAKAASIEKRILERTPRFVSCSRPFCPTCSLRLYW